MHVIGIDAGGSNTVCLVADEHGKIVGEGRGGGANLQTYGEREVENVLRRVIESAIGSHTVHVAAICLGVAGVDRPADADVVRDIIRRIGCEAPTVVVNDALVALVAGVGHDPGVVMVAGTGSIVYGRNGAGQAARAGGWGPVLGDEGGGFWIGRAALTAVTRHADGRGPATELTDLLLRHLGVSSASHLIREVYSHDPYRTATARMAELVQKAAEMGDRVALDILSRAAEELTVAAASVVKRLGLQDTAFTTILSGGAFRSIPRLIDSVVARMAHVAPHSSVRMLDVEPAVGAVRLSLAALRGSVNIPAYV
jgi:N-acetylglucosamine kinase-like BadF-type ATPase